MAHHKFLLFTALSNVCIVTIPPAIQDFRYDSHRFFLSLLPSIYPVSVRFSKPSFLMYPWNSDFSLSDSQYKQLRSHENWQSSQLDECLFSQICRVFLSVLWKNIGRFNAGPKDYMRVNEKKVTFKIRQKPFVCHICKNKCRSKADLKSQLQDNSH